MILIDLVYVVVLLIGTKVCLTDWPKKRLKKVLKKKNVKKRTILELLLFESCGKKKSGSNASKYLQNLFFFCWKLQFLSMFDTIRRKFNVHIKYLQWLAYVIVFFFHLKLASTLNKTIFSGSISTELGSKWAPILLRITAFEVLKIHQP